MNKTGIDYLTHTWNPLAMRCTKVSPACDHCWHLAMVNRLAANPVMSDESRAAYAGETGPVLIESRLNDPLKHKKPAVIGVQFTGDLFHEGVPLEFFIEILNVIAETPQHTYQFLTKRPVRMNEMICAVEDLQCDRFDSLFPNVWLGVTAENQAAADQRRVDFEATPAAVKFVSYEPALAPVDWTGWEFVSQIISGGETGPGARPSHPDWHRATRDFCQANGIAYFFKSHGEHITEAQYMIRTVSRLIPIRLMKSPGFVRVGKKRAGHLLDGREWREMPGGAK